MCALEISTNVVSTLFYSYIKKCCWGCCFFLSTTKERLCILTMCVQVYQSSTELRSNVCSVFIVLNLGKTFFFTAKDNNVLIN